MKALILMYKHCRAIIMLNFVCAGLLQAAQAPFICEEKSHEEDAPNALFKGVTASCSDGKRFFIKPYVVNASSVLKDMLADGVTASESVQFDRFSSNALKRLESLILRKKIDDDFFYNDIIEFAELCHFLQIDDEKYRFISCVIRSLIPYAYRYTHESLPPILEEECQNAGRTILAIHDQYYSARQESIPLSISFATRFHAQQQNKAIWTSHDTTSDATNYSILHNRNVIEYIQSGDMRNSMVALSADGNYGALNLGLTVSIYDMEKKAVCDSIPVKGLLTSLSFDGQGKRIALEFLHGIVQLYDREKKEYQEVKHTKTIKQSSLSHDGQSLFFSAGTKLYAYDIEHKKETMLFQCDDYIESFKQSRTGRYLVAANRDGTVVLYDRDQQEIIDTLIFNKALCSVALTNDARYIMILSRLNKIHVYDREEKTTRAIMQGYNCRIDDIDIVSDNDVHYFVINNTIYQRLSTLKEILLALRTEQERGRVIV